MFHGDVDVENESFHVAVRIDRNIEIKENKLIANVTHLKYSSDFIRFVSSKCSSGSSNNTILRKSHK